MTLSFLNSFKFNKVTNLVIFIGLVQVITLTCSLCYLDLKYSPLGGASTTKDPRAFTRGLSLFIRKLIAVALLQLMLLPDVCVTVCA